MENKLLFKHPLLGPGIQLDDTYSDYIWHAKASENH